MPAMKKNNFNIIVEKILKHKNKVIEIDKVKQIIMQILDSEYSDKKSYKIIFHLKNKWYLVNLKKSIFLAKTPEKQYTENQLLDMFYRCIAKKHCKNFLNSKWYIWGIKALELNVMNFDIPEELLIINENKQSNETLMFEKQIIFKTYKSEQNNLFNFFRKYTKKVYIWKNVFDIANLELAILESLYNPSIINQWYTEELIKKILRKNKKNLDLNIFQEILKKNKHHSSINRLYTLARGIDPEMAVDILNIIKRHWHIIA